MPVRAKPKTASYPEQHERDAARRYLEHSHAAATLKGRPAEHANEHATAIDEEHPRARDIALTGTARELPGLPAHLRRHQRQERELAGITTDEAAEIRRGYRAGPYREDRTETEGSRPSPARRAAGHATGHFRDVAGAAADTSTGELIGEFLMGGMALSIGYLLLTRAAAAGKLFQGATTAVRAVISPVVDPLNPKGAL